MKESDRERHSKTRSMQRKGKEDINNDYLYDRNKSFMEKWREHVKNKKETGGANKRLEYFFRGLFLFQTPTQLYVLLLHILPYMLSDSGPWSLYLARVLCCFMVVNLFANWFLAILHDPSYTKTKDNPYIDFNRNDQPPDVFRPLIQEAVDNQNNGSAVYDMEVKDSLPWSFCKYCEIRVPPRTYHCKMCKKCIMKRDHHCVMIGNCVGFNNQRYFFMWLFYGFVYECFGFILTYNYLCEVYSPIADSWKDYIFIFSIWRWMFGRTKGLFCLMVVQITIEFVFTTVSLFYFGSQVKMTFTGLTMFEVVKKVPIKNTNTYRRNARSVFGGFWYLNFFFPLTPVFRQLDDGVQWEGLQYDRTAYKKWKDDGELM